jgi:uncharacterized protein YcaQ
VTTGSITLAALRRHVVAHQGFATRLRKSGADEVETAIRRLSGVQLDSISTVERSHRIVLTSRVGNYPRGTVSALLSQGRIFEYWAHEACLLPVEDFPLFRWRMRGRGHWDSHDRALREHPEVAEHVLAEIQARGPLGSRDFEGEGGGGMWNWKPAKRVLDSLWDRGDLSIAGRQGFQRLYDLTERVIPRPVLDAPVPSDGDALVAEGQLQRLAVDDGGPAVLVPAGMPLGERVAPGATLLSPFDNLLWDRPFAERVFGFKHVMEIYKPPSQRVYGYYVLPLLRRDGIVGRADLKSDRKRGELRLLAFHREPGVRDTKALGEALRGSLERLARAAGLERVVSRGSSR